MGIHRAAPLLKFVPAILKRLLKFNPIKKEMIMAFGAVEAVFWEDGTRNSSKNQNVYGKMVGKYSGATGGDTDIPGNATIVSVFVQADSYVSIESSASTPNSTDIPVPATQWMDIEIPAAAHDGTWKLNFATA